LAPSRLNYLDPQAWLANVLARIAGIPASRLEDLCHGTGARPLAHWRNEDTEVHRQFR
jgi:hypothetical protein